MKRHTHHTSAPNKLNLYIAPFSVRSALCKTALFSDAPRMERGNKVIIDELFCSFLFIISQVVFFLNAAIYHDYVFFDHNLDKTGDI